MLKSSNTLRWMEETNMTNTHITILFLANETAKKSSNVIQFENTKSETKQKMKRVDKKMHVF